MSICYYFFCVCLQDIVQISLWGNKCDLSISGGDDNAQTVLDLHKNLESFYPDLLVDDSNLIWKHLEGGKKSNKQVFSGDLRF